LFVFVWFFPNKIILYLKNLTTDNPGNFIIEAKWIILIMIIFAFSILIAAKIVIGKAEKNKDKAETKAKSIKIKRFLKLKKIYMMILKKGCSNGGFEQQKKNLLFKKKII
jgi:hypothetical protein